MQFKMSDNSLFAMLLRSPWWLSFVIALVLGLGGRALLPEGYVFIAPALAFPFVIAGFVALRKQWDLPSEARIEETVDAVAAMSATDCACPASAAAACRKSAGCAWPRPPPQRWRWSAASA